MTASPQPSSTLEFTVKLGRGPCDPHAAVEGCESSGERMPRITKLLALAIKLERMLEQGEVKNRAALARAGQVSRARLTQIMSLVDLAPGIQEHILYMSCPVQARDLIRERQLRAVTKLVRWDQQQRRYEELLMLNGRRRGVGKGDDNKWGAGEYIPAPNVP